MLHLDAGTAFIIFDAVKLVSKISNLCDHNPITSQTDRQTDNMQSQDRALYCSASRGKSTNISVSLYI